MKSFLQIYIRLGEADLLEKAAQFQIGCLSLQFSYRPEGRKLLSPPIVGLTITLAWRGVRRNRHPYHVANHYTPAKNTLLNVDIS